MTLIELLISIVLLSLIVLGFASINVFSRYHVITSDRRAKLQNEVSYCMEHMTRNISMAFGNTEIDPVNSEVGGDAVDVQLCRGGGRYVAVAVYIQDTNGDRRPTIDVDRRVAYFFDNINHTLNFYPNYTRGCRPWLPNENLSNRIIAFNPVFARDLTTGIFPNNIGLEVAACWDPTEATQPCGTPDNPSISMRTRARMPAVSNH